MLKQSKTFFTDLWALTRPYWFSEERWAARGLLAVIIALNLGLVYINVLLNQWNNDFYNTLQNMDQGGFFRQLMKFAMIAASLYRGRGLPALSQPDAADPLAALAHRQLSRRMDRQAHLLPAAAHRLRAPTIPISGSPTTWRCSATGP